MRLKKWVKVVLTIILLISTIVMWFNVGEWGKLVQTSKLHGILVFFGWIWIITQPFIIDSIWED